MYDGILLISISNPTKYENPAPVPVGLAGMGKGRTEQSLSSCLSFAPASFPKRLDPIPSAFGWGLEASALFANLLESSCYHLPAFSITFLLRMTLLFPTVILNLLNLPVHQDHLEGLLKTLLDPTSEFLYLAGLSRAWVFVFLVRCQWYWHYHWEPYLENLCSKGLDHSNVERSLFCGQYEMREFPGQAKHDGE